MEKEQKTEQALRMSKSCPAFNLVKDNEGKVRISIGSYIASNAKFNNFEQADRYIGTKPWELIINIIGIVLQHGKNSKKSAKTSKKNAESTKSN